jgi:hypothetical protein
MIRTVLFIAGALLIVAVAVVFIFLPGPLIWLAHHPVLDGFVALLALVLHWFNTYSPKDPFVPKV